MKWSSLASHVTRRTIWKPDKNVQMYGFRMVHSKTGPFEIQTNVYHLNTGLVWYSDGYCTGQEMVNSCPIMNTIGIPDILGLLVT